MKAFFVASIGLTMTGQSALADCSVASGPPKASNYTFSTLAYETIDGSPVLLDLFVPKDVVNPPLVVLVHGGGWSANDRTVEDKNAAFFTAYGYAAASLDYRLVMKKGVNFFPAAVQDIRCGVRWLRANAASLGFDGSHIGAYGGSAGGNLVGMLGAAAGASGDLDGPYCSVGNSTSVAVQIVADYYGLNDSTDSSAFNAEQLHNFGKYLGVNPLQYPAISLPASAVNYVNSTLPPFVIVRGAADTQMPKNQSVDLVNALQSSGVPNQYFDVAGLKHGFRHSLSVSSHRHCNRHAPCWRPLRSISNPLLNSILVQPAPHSTVLLRTTPTNFDAYEDRCCQFCLQPR